MPDWALKNSTLIVNAGLFSFTSLMIASAFRGKAIGKAIYEEQERLLKSSGFEGDALKSKMSELIDIGVIKIPALHRQRMTYLGTAIASFATGVIFKPKVESPEQMQTYSDMSWPGYLGTRIFQVLDPVNHSRQTAGFLAATSGVLAAISGLSQPGGALKSEILVGATLIGGGASLLFIKDPDQAKEMFSACWWGRLPAVVTGTYETMWTKPSFKHPLTKELTHMPFWRMDISYPIGQWGNMSMAAFGLLTAGAEMNKKMHDNMPAVEFPDNKINEANYEQLVIKPQGRQQGVSIG